MPQFKKNHSVNDSVKNIIKIVKKYNILIWILLSVVFIDGSNLDDFVFPNANHVEVEGDASFSNIVVNRKHHKNDLKSRPEKDGRLKKQKITNIDSPGLPIKPAKQSFSNLPESPKSIHPSGIIIYKTGLYLLHCSLLI